MIGPRPFERVAKGEPLIVVADDLYAQTNEYEISSGHA